MLPNKRHIEPMLLSLEQEQLRQLPRRRPPVWRLLEMVCRPVLVVAVYQLGIQDQVGDWTS
jgi:hypothetical protein